MMNLWDKKKEKLRQKFTGIASKDLSFKPGKEFEMIEKVRKKLGKTAKELLTIIIEF